MVNAVIKSTIIVLNSLPIMLISILTNQVSSIGFVGLMAFNYASKITASLGPFLHGTS